MLIEDFAALADPEQVDVVAAKAAAAARLLREAAGQYVPAVFTSSLGAEDMVLTDLIWAGGIDIPIATLDTGRLPNETYELMAKAERHYGRRLLVYYPEQAAVEALVERDGINGFYHSVEARRACCHVRKVEPLKRALAGRKAWITGLRAGQAATRGDLALKSEDAVYGLTKINPLADWSEADVWIYLHAHRVPFNSLHLQRFPSIGCAPCTRPIQPGEDIRAGRWWWEAPQTKECGLHWQNGVLQRARPTGLEADRP